MKEKRIFVLGLAILAMFLFFTEPVVADYGWRPCSVIEVGLSDTGNYEITLMTKTGKEQTFIITGDETNRMLALALTAMQNDLRVQVCVDWHHTAGDTITGLIILKD